MKTIIALKGIGDSGKSTTIGMLYRLLSSNNNYHLVEKDYDPNGGDFIAVFSRNGMLIGITSSGDKYDLVHDKLEKLINMGCVICVCACRSFDRYGHGTIAAISEFTNFQALYIEKEIAITPDQENAINHNDAQRLFEAIEGLI
ncbi:MAG: hypothetical protein WC868_06235 [Bacteroidales bacterium]